jgi:hypothetical protein
MDQLTVASAALPSERPTKYHNIRMSDTARGLVRDPLRRPVPHQEDIRYGIEAIVLLTNRRRSFAEIM